MLRAWLALALLAHPVAAGAEGPARLSPLLLTGAVRGQAEPSPLELRPTSTGRDERRPRQRDTGLSVDVPRTAAIAAGALAVWGVTELARGELSASSCRWCEPPALDRKVRSALAWSNDDAAGLLSDVLLVALPATLAGADLFMAGRDLRRASEDVLVAMEPVAIAALAAQLAKFTAARRRPGAWAAGVRGKPDDDRAFFSGHVATTFAAAAAFGTVARLRGYPHWQAVYAAGFSAATVVGYLRIAADEHWITDVAAAAAVGTALGLAMPLLLHRGREQKLSFAPLGGASAGLWLSGRF